MRHDFSMDACWLFLRLARRLPNSAVGCSTAVWISELIWRWYEACAAVSICTVWSALCRSPISLLPSCILASLLRRLAYSSSIAALGLG